MLVKELDDQIKNDIRFSGFINSFKESDLYTIDFESLYNELKNSHVTRQIRLISTEDILRNTTSVINALRENQAKRSYCVEVKLTIQKRKMLLESNIESISLYIRKKFQTLINSTFSNQTDKTSYIKSLFDDMQETLNNYNTLISFCDVVIDDIDHTYWTYKSIIDCIKITDEAKHINI